MKITRELKPCCESMAQMAEWGYVYVGLLTNEVKMNMWRSLGEVKHVSDLIQYCPYCGAELEVRDVTVVAAG